MNVEIERKFRICQPVRHFAVLAGRRAPMRTW